MQVHPTSGYFQGRLGAAPCFLLTRGISTAIDYFIRLELTEAQMDMSFKGNTIFPV